MKSRTVRLASGLAVLALAPLAPFAQSPAFAVSTPYAVTPEPPPAPDETDGGETSPYPEDTETPETTETPGTESPETTATPGATATPGMTATPGATPGAPGAPVGPACAELPQSGKGSLAELAKQPAATAIADIPQLATLSKAIDAAELKDKLDQAENVTIFAPTDQAFQQIPRDELDTLLGNKEELTKVLNAHVVDERVSKEDLANAKLTNADGGELTVTGSGDQFTISGEGIEAKIVCGAIPVKNGTLYLIDKVLMSE
ncbi:fasciclin domain-containing protein [Spongiactinospora sp. TRM90649]|uniref:fasciclin domain-containing protein n=1 Tax=Spongiactinospora sp. TRM90649 TaxID=3031114 RepID=UPI0023F86FFB|nr:fasciclin domain-containing protein [Spongiactinospora sp. TRM90649]MDF5754512.1 fasciclin domain-containing protein [Spongiactinospora sp. TRM90649]